MGSNENCNASQGEKRPNVIWIFGDQHRAQALSCNGDPNVNTPNLDNLAALGVNFTSAVSGFPLCCPFRGSLLTGKYPHNCVPGHEYQMPPEYPTIATVFNERNYKTAYFGKWHLDGFQEKNGRAAMHIVPPERRGGFQKWVGYENNNSQWDSWVHGGEGDQSFHYRLPGYETDELTNLLIEYIKQRTSGQGAEQDSAFFAVLSVQPPHNPYVAPAEYMGKHNPSTIKFRPNVPDIMSIRETAGRDLAGSYAMIENLDWNIGRILKSLDDLGILKNTHIMYFSDHGDMHGSHGHFRKTSPYEESLRIPFIIGGEQPFLYNERGVGRFSVPINHVDIAPTTLGLCGIDKPEWMQGTDYSHYRIKNRKADKEPDSAYIQSSGASIQGTLMIDKAWRGIVTKDGWKYVCFEGMPWMMFNLNEDPYELVNLVYYKENRGKVRQLNDRLRAWITDTNDSFTLPEF